MRFSLTETGLALCKKEIYISLGTLRGRLRTSLPCQIPLSEKSIIFAPCWELKPKHGVDVHSPYLRGRNSGVEFSVWVRGSLSVFRIRIRENTNSHFHTTFPQRWSQRRRPRPESPYGHTASHAPAAVPANVAKSRSVERFSRTLLVLIDASATRRNRAATASASACPAISS